jgi:uncharacterized protein YciI
MLRIVHHLLIVLILILAGAITVFAQERTTAADTLQPETFEYQQGDTTYVMQKYFMAFLKSGTTRSQSKEEAMELQQKHLAYIQKLNNEGHISLSGPFAGDGEIRGILVFNTATIEEARKLANQDPSVKAGRLIIEIHPWWAAKGSKLQ